MIRGAGKSISRHISSPLLSSHLLCIPPCYHELQNTTTRSASNLPSSLSLLSSPPPPLTLPLPLARFSSRPLPDTPCSSCGCSQLSTSLYLTYMQHHVRRVAQELSRQADGRSHRGVHEQDDRHHAAALRQTLPSCIVHTPICFVCEPPAVQVQLQLQCSCTAVRTEQSINAVQVGTSTRTPYVRTGKTCAWPASCVTLPETSSLAWPLIPGSWTGAANGKAGPCLNRSTALSSVPRPAPLTLPCPALHSLGQLSFFCCSTQRASAVRLRLSRAAARRRCTPPRGHSTLLVHSCCQ
ncbi:hypothetical protein GGI42DRAFT_135156 [Trichoderma sp. SZMC 28013]